MTIWTLDFWKAAAERSVKTFAQTGAALLTAAGTGLIETDWQTSASVAGMAAVISLLTSIGSDALTGSGPSLTNAETLPEDMPNQSTYILGKAFTGGTFSKDAEDRRRRR